MMKSRHFNTEERKNPIPAKMRIIFAVIMIAIYVGAGLTLLFNWFNIIYDPNWNLLRWIGGPLLVLYGIFRAYRQFKGIDSPVR